MKKILIVIPLIVSSCILQGCRKHVYHTYYGDIDIDTIKPSFQRYETGNNYYKVDSTAKDSFFWQNRWFYIKGPIITYFCPQDDVYEQYFPDNSGRMIGKEIDPYHNMDWLNK